MKIYKIYAECVRTTKAIQEITMEEAKKIVVSAVDDMINNGIYGISAEDDEEVNAEYEEYYNRAIKYFEQNERFECGDFCVEITDEPVRSNICGYTEFI